MIKQMHVKRPQNKRKILEVGQACFAQVS